MLYSIRLLNTPGATDEDLAARREAHRRFLRDDAAQVWFAGPLLADDSDRVIGSHRLMAFDDEAAADEHVRGDPYVTAGLQGEAEVTPWSNSVPYTWRDCPRTAGNVQCLIIAYDKPDSDDLRDGLRRIHEDYQASVAHLYITRGPLMNAAGDRQIGSLMIVDVPDMAAGRAFWEGEPFYGGGLFERVEVYRWRFGRDFDRLRSEAADTP